MKSPEKNPLDVLKGREQEIGPLLGILIILVILMAGAFYFWMYGLNGAPKRSSTATTTEVIIYRHATSQATSSGSQASSTDNVELNAIENSLESQTQGIDNLNF